MHKFDFQALRNELFKAPYTFLGFIVVDTHSNSVWISPSEREGMKEIVELSKSCYVALFI